jgi:hypothetical protein
MNDAQVQALAQASNAMAELAERECWNDDKQNPCTLESPKCDTCSARRAMALIDQVLGGHPETLHADRLTNPPERIYYERWCKENQRHSWLNSGFTTLEWILCPTNQSRPGPVNPHDAKVAATVIQWLGTNCGHGFLRQCEAEIARDRGDRGVFEHAAWQAEYNHKPLAGPPFLDEWAHTIASRYCSITKIDHPPMERAIRAALALAYAAGWRGDSVPKGRVEHAKVREFKFFDPDDVGPAEVIR